jgi:hypothetical protein
MLKAFLVTTLAKSGRGYFDKSPGRYIYALRQIMNSAAVVPGDNANTAFAIGRGVIHFEGLETFQAVAAHEIAHYLYGHIRGYQIWVI